MNGLTLIILVCLHALGAEVSGSAVIDSSLRQRFFSGKTDNVLISFNLNIQTVINSFNALNFSSLAEKRKALTEAQEAFSNRVQKPVQAFLNAVGTKFETYWISNSMVVFNVNFPLIQAMARISGVAKIEKEPVVSLSLPMSNYGAVEDRSEEHGRQTRQTSVGWGITKIRADQVWGSYKGKGIVVAGIDTGVRYTHETLKARWRSLYGWFDPYGQTATPNDQNGHGTHTMGTITGSLGIGVAPEATWIACKGCDTKGCSGSTLLKCGQWVQCPTLTDGSGKDCSKAPQVVSNSWSGPGGNTWYDGVIDSWQASGIIPVFTSGNTGPSCETVRTPGDRAKVIAVGSTDSSDGISSFSSRGPSNEKRVKPDVVAPGSQIRSAWYTSDTAYQSLQGTSMACPHVSGMIALMLQKKKSLTYAQVYTAVTNSTVRTLSQNNANTCGGKAPTQFPNNVFGYGRIDAVNALKAF